MPIDTSVPYSDGWVLEQLYRILREQQKHADEMHKRYIGDPPLPAMNDQQKEAVKWFIKKARTNFERLIVGAVVNRLRIRGIRTAVDPDEGGDAKAFAAWKKSRGKLWAKQVHKYAATMGRGFVMVGIDKRNKLLVTAEDPRHVAVMTDPADELRVESAIKLIYDPVSRKDIAYLFRMEEGKDGSERVRMRIATRDRASSSPASRTAQAFGGFDSMMFDWSILGADENDPDVQVTDFYPEWLQGDEDRPAMIPIVPFINEDGMAEFEPHLEILDRITQQILQRMTTATIQAFKQRAIKGLPRTDPKTGEDIDYDNVFTAEPGAIWQLPAAAEIWESGEANLQGILLSVRDDIKDLAAVSGTPLYSITPDAANGSAEGASLQRETLTFKVEDRQDRFELPHERVVELIFRTLAHLPDTDPVIENGGKAGDKPDKTESAAEQNMKRSEPGTIEIMWAPADRPSMSERANAIAQTKGSIPIYLQMTEIWGLPPDQADRAMSMIQEDATRAAALAPPGGGGGGPRPQQGQRVPPGAQKAPQRQEQPSDGGIAPVR